MQLVLEIGGFRYVRIVSKYRPWSEMCSDVIDILVQSSGTITCAANIFTNLHLETFQCNCCRSFRRQGDLTRL